MTTMMAMHNDDDDNVGWSVEDRGVREREISSLLRERIALSLSFRKTINNQPLRTVPIDDNNDGNT